MRPCDLFATLSLRSSIGFEIWVSISVSRLSPSRGRFAMVKRPDTRRSENKLGTDQTSGNGRYVKFRTRFSFGTTPEPGRCQPYLDAISSYRANRHGSRNAVKLNATASTRKVSGTKSQSGAPVTAQKKDTRPKMIAPRRP